MDIKIGNTVIVNGRVGVVISLVDTHFVMVRDLGANKLNVRKAPILKVTPYRNYSITCFAIFNLLTITFKELFSSVMEQESREFVNECWESVKAISEKYLNDDKIE